MKNPPTITHVVGSGRWWPSGGALRSRRALTLVEMLVAVALLMLMMAIVGQVVGMASDAARQLRASHVLLERIRFVESTLRFDLRHRTIRSVSPRAVKVGRWLPGPDSRPGRAGVDDDGDGYRDFIPEAGPGQSTVFIIDRDELGAPGSDDVYIEYYVPVGVDPRENAGYFMIEENSPADEQGEDGDDVLAFTVSLSATGSRSPEPWAGYIGRCVPGSEPDRALPPPDDGLTSSPYAEVIYFVRQGTLYRRVLLVDTPQPSAAFYNPAISWYAQYDISARPPSVGGTVPVVNTLGDLTYRSTRYGMTAPAGYLLSGLAADSPADPNFPFGPTPTGDVGLSFDDRVLPNGCHDTLDHSAATRDRSWENATSGAGVPYPGGGSPVAATEEIWWGRPTLRESSAPGWDYPNQFAGGRWTPSITTALRLPGGLRRFDPWAPGNAGAATDPLRAAEDVLLQNVVSFDVKVWDPTGGAPSLGAQQQGAYGPGAFVDLGYQALDPYGANGPPPGPLPGAGWVGESNLNDRVLEWNTAMIALSPWPLDPLVIQPDALLSADTIAPPPQEPHVAYRNRLWPPLPRHVVRLRNGSTNGSPVEIGGPGFGYPWLGFQGLYVRRNAQSPYTDAFVPTLLPPPQSLWQTYDTWCSVYSLPATEPGAGGTAYAMPYPLPLKAIQITIRFIDEATGETRQITIVEELQ